MTRLLTSSDACASRELNSGSSRRAIRGGVERNEVHVLIVEVGVYLGEKGLSSR